MYRPENLVIDNEKLKLFDELNKIINEQKTLSVATAYFNVAGFSLVKESLLKTEHFRLLLGIYTDECALQPDLFEPELQYKQKLRKDIEDEDFHHNIKDTVIKLISFLKQSSVEVKLYKKSFLHGKAYIFEKLAIVGSSNFTFAGFTSNTELNAVLDEAHSRYIKEEWFEKLWTEATDFKQELITILDASKFGTKEYLPYHIFIKSLYELQKDDILFDYETPEEMPSTEVDLANFQEDAVKRIYSRLKTYNGVLVADSVGLGKTWIAKKIIEDFGFYRRRRFVVICPASVDETLWRPALKDIGVSENILHQEELGSENIDFDFMEKEIGFKLEDVALFVIDESHNFRNPFSNRYENLFTLIEKASGKTAPKILLLTATPMNNTHWDLYFQLMLIARNDKRIFAKEGIFNLENQFKKADKGDIAQLSDILQSIAIRRTRQYIKANYPDAKYKDINGIWISIKFPYRKLNEINYSLDETYQGLYHKIADKVEKELTLAYYRLEEYKTAGEKDVLAMGRMKALGGILQTILLKRLESSVEAFRKSIQSQIKFLKKFEEFFKQGKVLKKKFYDKYISYLEGDLDDNSYIFETIGKYLESINISEYNGTAFMNDIKKDISIFEELFCLVNPIDISKDAKLVELKNTLIKLKNKGKILLFSFYADTIDYLYNALNDKNDEQFQKDFGKRIECVTGSFPMLKRKEIINDFLESDIDVLLSTDILSEGQNLQKAGICINYDLHWNPVRMIQRAGRIDRIGSSFEEINIYNFYPEKELESLLELVRILEKKINLINETVGLDASVLGEIINPKVFGIIRNLRRDEQTKEKVLQNLEEEQFGGGENFWQPLKDFGLDKLKEFCEELPHGIQSGLVRDLKGIFFYYKYDEDYHLWYLYDIMQKKIITNKTEILNYISCKPNEPRIIPDGIDVFQIHEEVKKEIQKFFSANLVATQIRTAHGRMEKTLAEMRDELDYIRENYLEQNDPLKNSITDIVERLHNVALTKKRMQEIRRIWRVYKNTKNWQVFITEIMSFLKQKPVTEQIEQIEFDEKKLTLISVDFIS
jgi:superfamily II DNA or RNA helicase